MLEKKWWPQERDALIHIFRHHRNFIDGHVGIVRQMEFNAYVPDEINRESLNNGPIAIHAEFWNPEAIAIHFAGCWYFPLCGQKSDSITVGPMKTARNGGIFIGREGNWWPESKTEVGV